MGTSLILSLVLKYILPFGLDWLEHLTSQKKAQIKEFVFSMVPGTMFDAAVWSVVEGLLPKIFEAARALLTSRGHATAVSDIEIAHAVLSVANNAPAPKPFLMRD